MLWILGIVAAEYYQVGNGDLYIGLDASGREVKLVERNKAVNFRRVLAPGKKIFTHIYADNNEALTFNQSKRLIVQQPKLTEPAAFLVILELNGRYVFNADEQCLYASGSDLMHGPCVSTDNGNITIHRSLHPDGYKKKEVIQIDKRGSLPIYEDPIGDKSLEIVKNEDLLRILLPYAERVDKGKEMKVDNPQDKPRVFRRFDIL